MTEPQILDGIRILDLSQGIAGPVATMLLAESGADVVKVEPPGGDFCRGLPGFATWNRSKRGVVLDLKEADGRAKLDGLLAGADVLVHTFRPQDAARYGLDDASLAARFPALIVSSVPGWPIDHPDRDRPAYDALVLARAGHMDEQQGSREGPIFIRIPLASWGAAHLAASGIMARLISRGRTGKAGPAHTSLLQGSLIPMTMHWATAERPTGGFVRGLPKGARPTLFECADGVWIHLMHGPEPCPLWQSTAAGLTPQEIAENDVESAFRGPRFPSLFGAYIAGFKKHPSTAWLPELWANDVPAEPAVPLGKVFFDEQANLNGYVTEWEDHQFGRIRGPGNPLATTPPARIKGSAPKLGADTAQVLSEKWAAPTLSGSGRSLRSPLEGVKVLDFGNFLAGPLAPMLMADLGADVVKLEALTGDQMRGTERVFSGCQRGKRGVAADLRRPDSREVVEALAKWADVVHHNIRMPAAARLGIDYESIRAMNPNVVYCHTSSYGPIGPRKDWPGYDQLFQASSGWEYEGAGEGNPPMWHRFGMMDHQCALASLVATLLGLYHRDRTGKGQFVAASLLGTSILTISETHVRGDGTLAPYPRLDARQTGLDAGYRIYQLADGWICVAAFGDAALGALQRVAGASSVPAIEAALALRRCDEALAALEQAGVPCEPVRLAQLEPFLASPANVASGLSVSYEHAEWGQMSQIGALWNFGDLACSFPRSSPVIGEDTREVLLEAGLSEHRVAELAAAGTIAWPGSEAASK